MSIVLSISFYRFLTSISHLFSNRLLCRSLMDVFQFQLLLWSFFFRNFCFLFMIFTLLKLISCSLFRSIYCRFVDYVWFALLYSFLYRSSSCLCCARLSTWTGYFIYTPGVCIFGNLSLEYFCRFFARVKNSFYVKLSYNCWYSISYSLYVWRYYIAFNVTFIVYVGCFVHRIFVAFSALFWASIRYSV